MILYPAIDLKEGRCVRLIQGDMEQATIYNDDPAAQARIFEGQGFTWLHVVDLDGAFAGTPVNREAVAAILGAVSIPLQLGGGIRDMATAEAWLEAGVSRVIMGTAALRDPDLVAAACRAFPGQVAIAIDARDGRVAVEGWAEVSNVSAVDLARAMDDAGAAAIIYTNVERDGTGEGLDIEGVLHLARAVETPVIASGGVASLDDLAALKEVVSVGVGGVILGRALYDGRLDPVSALALAAS